MSVIATAGTGSPGASAARAVGRAEVTGTAAGAVAPATSLDPSPAATPIRIGDPVVAHGEQAEQDGEVPDRPVIQAGPGPATPVDGATTLIDPLVIER